ncbi:SDR family oxidoreductase [Spirochaetota bacterium]
MKDLTGKNIVVTGAAMGIGKHICSFLAKEKANLAIIDINRAKLNVVEKELSSHDIKVKSYICDISKRTDIESTGKKIIKDFKNIDILINNAGVAIGNTILDSTFSDLKSTMDINFIGLAWMTRQFLPGMVKNNDGHIVNISSAMGLLGVPKMSAYSASKFAIIGYTDTLRMEMKKYGHRGIKTTIVCPSGINTGMFSGYKPPFLSPLLDQTELAKKIVRAIKKEKTYLKLPFMVKMVPFIKGLPAVFVDWLAEILGSSKCMDHYTGKKDK